MTPQEIINKVYTGIMAQGGPSLGAGSFGLRCLYDNGAGRQCAVGLFLTPAIAEQADALSDDNGTDITELLASHLSNDLPDWFRANVDLLSDLQEIHDNYYDGGFTPKSWHENIAHVATKHKLEVPARVGA